MTPSSHHLGPPWRPFVLGIVLLAIAAPVFGQAVYNYQGNNYDEFTGSAFNGNMSVSGSFTLPLALPPNLTLQTVNTPGLNFSLFNGIRDFTFANSVVCDFDVATGPTGLIVQWFIFLREPAIPASDPQATLVSTRIVSAEDGGFISISNGVVCDSLGSSDAGQVKNNPGTWTRDAGQGVPALPRWAWALLLALLAVAGAATLRAKQRA